MRSSALVAASCVGASLLALLAISVPAAAAPKPITGKLSKPGYTMIALAANDKATAVRARRGRFRLRPPAKRVTLHLRGPDGTYAGPIVAGREGKRAIVGVTAGADLGRIKVNARKGYAKVKRKLPDGSLDARRTARAKKGVPIGAGKFGRVRSRNAEGPRADRDLDGIPAPLDIDDDGDLTLDDLDRSTAARAAQALAAQALDNPLFVSDLTMGLDQTANANAPGSTDQKIDAAFTGSGQGARLRIGIPDAASTELDCGGAPNPSPPPPWVGGLVYCTSGGTGRVEAGVPPPPFPDCCDPDNDGFGTLVPPPNPPPNSGAGAMTLVHGATTAQFKTGDVVIKRINDANGVEIGAFPATLQYVFATVPALVSYSDGQGNSATVSYPVSPDGPGTEANAFSVAAGPSGDVVVTLTFWRPQRRRIAGDPEPQAGESATWTDIGGLNYTAALENGEFGCPQSAFSEDDPNLTLPSSPVQGNGGFTDLALDRPASAANKLTYTLNLTQCLASSWTLGETRRFHFVTSPPNAGGVATQIVVFKRQ